MTRLRVSTVFVILSLCLGPKEGFCSSSFQQQQENNRTDPLVVQMLKFQQAMNRQDAEAAGALLAVDSVALIPAGVHEIKGRRAIVAAWQKYFSELEYLHEDFVGPVVVSGNFGAFEKIITQRQTGNTHNTTYTVVNWFEFAPGGTTIRSFTAVFNVTQIHPDPHGSNGGLELNHDEAEATESASETLYVRKMLAFQDAMNRRDADGAGALLTKEAVARIPAGVQELHGRDAIVASWRDYFASLDNIDEKIVGPIVVSGDFGAFEKTITTWKKGEKHGSTSIVVNWFEFDAHGAITTFSAVFNETSPPPPFPPSALDKLRHTVAGDVLTPGDKSYADAIRIDNEGAATSPAVVVRVANPNDVVVAMDFAERYRMAFTVKGGGHSAAGYCLNEGGVVIDTSLMNDIHLDTATGVYSVGAGARWIDVYSALNHTGWVPVGGACATVGVVGFTLGGGYSFLSRSLGLAADNLIAVDMVDATGHLLHLDRHNLTTSAEKDLWWALQGGGGGNFGVVTRLTMQSHHPNAPQLLLAKMCYNLSSIERVGNAWVPLAVASPPELAVYAQMGLIDDELQLCLQATYNGQPAKGISLLQPLLAPRSKATPTPRATLQNETLFVWEEENGNGTAVSGRAAYIKSGIIASSKDASTCFQETGFKAFASAMASAPSDSCRIIVTHTGGQVSTVSLDSTAYPWRNAAFVYEVKAEWPINDPDAKAKHMAWADGLHRDIAPCLEGSYVNYVDPGLGDWATRYYGPHYPRLQDIKRQWDPQNRFNFPQSIRLPE